MKLGLTADDVEYLRAPPTEKHINMKPNRRQAAPAKQVPKRKSQSNFEG